MALLPISFLFFSFAYQMRSGAKRGGLTWTHLDTDGYLAGRVTQGRMRGHSSEALSQRRAHTAREVSPHGKRGAFVTSCRRVIIFACNLDK